MTFEEFIDEWQSECGYISARTSGSTGTPKAIRLDKEFVRASALRTVGYFGLTGSSRLHSCVAADFIGGKMMAVRALETGARFSWETPSNRPLADLRPAETIDLLAAVPSQMLHIIDRIDDMPLINAVIIGGGGMTPALAERIAASGLNAYETYGMTETASHIALRRVGEEWFGPLKGISVGLNGEGCLVIDFDSGERVVTNDLAEVNAAGGFRIKGRADHVIITGGRKVNPVEVENRVSDLVPYPFRIAWVPDAKWGQEIVMEVETDGEIDSQAMLEHMRARLSPWEVPKRILRVGALPRTGNGKVRHGMSQAAAEKR